MLVRPSVLGLGVVPLSAGRRRYCGQGWGGVGVGWMLGVGPLFAVAGTDPRSARLQTVFQDTLLHSDTVVLPWVRFQGRSWVPVLGPGPGSGFCGQASAAVTEGQPACQHRANHN